MKALIPHWPSDLPRKFHRLATFENGPRFNAAQLLDQIALAAARDLRRQMDGERQSNLTGTWTELLYVNTADFAAVATTAAEASLLTPGTKEQPTIPANFFFNKTGLGRGISLYMQGVLSTTSTPTIIFQVRTSTTQGVGTLSGASLGVSTAITTASGVTNQWWALRLDLICNVPGQGTGNCTLSGAGYVESPGGFAAPYKYALEPTTPPTATWTQTLDNSLTQYINASVTWGTSSASNTITAKQCLLAGLN